MNKKKISNKRRWISCLSEHSTTKCIILETLNATISSPLPLKLVWRLTFFLAMLPFDPLENIWKHFQKETSEIKGLKRSFVFTSGSVTVRVAYFWGKGTSIRRGGKKDHSFSWKYLTPAFISFYACRIQAIL